MHFMLSLMISLVIRSQVFSWVRFFYLLFGILFACSQVVAAFVSVVNFSLCIRALLLLVYLSIYF